MVQVCCGNFQAPQDVRFVPGREKGFKTAVIGIRILAELKKFMLRPVLQFFPSADESACFFVLRHGLEKPAVFLEIVYCEFIQNDYDVKVAYLGGFPSAVAALQARKQQPHAEFSLQLIGDFIHPTVFL